MPAAPTRTVLVVEDDHKIASLVAVYLRREGYRVVTAADGAAVLPLFGDVHPDFVVLDLMLPNVDGFEVCRALRRRSDVPILILSARSEEPDRLLGLRLGADDYLVKPFSPRELVARIGAILRRVRGSRVPVRSMLTHGRLTLDCERHRVTLGEAPIHLTPSEFKLLEILMTAPGRVFSRPELLDGLYPNGEAVVDRVVDVHIGKLRQKLEPDPLEPRLLLTVRGIGYQMGPRERSG